MTVNYPFTGISVLALAGLVAGCGTKEQKDTPKNIIFIMADDMGYGDLGCYGQEKIKTPHLDKMAEEGMLFTQFYSGSTVSAPSRCALMTGKHMGHAYIRGNTTEPLRAKDVTFVQSLKEAGYVTGMFGKWGLGEIGTTGAPEKKGFDAFTGYTDQVEAHFYYKDFIDKIVDGKTQEVPVDTTKYNHEIEMEDAIDFIRSHKDSTFFAYIPTRIPHSELIAPAEDMQVYLDEDGNSIFDEVPFKGDGHMPDQPMPYAAYAAMITKLDKDIGNIMQLLKDEGIADNTIMFFCSDNGGTKLTTDFFKSNGPLRGYKRDLYEGAIRVPMIVWGTESLPKGIKSDFIWAKWDVPATLADFAGVDLPFEHDGISVYDLLSGQEQKQTHEYIYHEYGVPWLNKFIQTVRKDEWKLVKAKYNIDPATYELYNLNEDIGETNDLSETNEEKVKELNKYIEQEHVSPVLEEFYYSSMPTGYDIPKKQLVNTDGDIGALTGKYYQGKDFNTLVTTKHDTAIGFVWGHGAPEGLPDDGFSIRWEGQLKINKTGKYTFYTAADDGVRLWLKDQLVIDDWNAHGVEIHSGEIELKEGQQVPLRFEYFENIGGAEVKLRWKKP